MNCLLSSCQSQLVTNIRNIQAVHTENTVHSTRPTYIWRDICLKKTMTAVARAKNTASYWRKYTVKTMLWVSEYLLKQPWVLDWTGSCMYYSESSFTHVDVGDRCWLTGNKNNRNCSEDLLTASAKCIFSAHHFNNCRYRAITVTDECDPFNSSMLHVLYRYWYMVLIIRQFIRCHNMSESLQGCIKKRV